MRIDWDQYVNESEELLRQGLISQFVEKHEKSRSDYQKAPRRLWVRLATNCRRANLLDDAIRLLMEPIQRAGVSDEPSMAEIIEYSSCLFRVGAANEAQSWLDRIDPEQEPKVLVQKAMQLVRYRESEKVVGLLRSYLLSDVVKGYQRAVAQINLGAALVAEEHYQEAMNLLAELLPTCEANGWNRLSANGFEIRAKVRVAEKNLDSAQQDLELAEEVLRAEGVVDTVLIEKGMAHINALRTGKTQALVEVSDKAQKQGHWETVRDIDVLLLETDYSVERLNRLYFGTPFASWRERIRARFPEVSDFYFIGDDSPENFLDLDTGEKSGESLLKPGKNIHKYLQALTTDFYRPTQLGSLFSSVFPGESYNPDSSPNKVYQLTNRFRKWIKDNSLEMELLEDKGNYQLVCGKGVSLRKSRSLQPVSAESFLLAKLRPFVEEKSFTTKQVTEYLNIGATRAFQFLKQGVELGEIEKTGSGKHTQFRLKS